MGIYDTYGTIQLKVGNVGMIQYEIGDEVELVDGVYVSPEGVVVIYGGRFVAQHPYLNDKWGGIIPTEGLLWR